MHEAECILLENDHLSDLFSCEVMIELRDCKLSDRIRRQRLSSTKGRLVRFS